MKKRLVSLMCASALVFCCGLSGCAQGGTQNSGAQNSQSGGSGGQQLWSGSTQKTCVYNINGQKVYNSGKALYIMRDDNTFEYVELEQDESSKSDEDHLPKMVRVYPDCIVSGTDAYSTYGDNCLIRHYDLSDLTNVKYETFYHYKGVYTFVKDAFEKCAEEKDKLSGMDYQIIAEDILRWDRMIDGGDGYIYIDGRIDKEIISKAWPVYGFIPRFAKDGSKIEFLTGFRAGDFTMRDGFIYYYTDAEYNYYEIDFSSLSGEDEDAYAGIYKARPDGSDKQLLVKFDATIDDTTRKGEKGSRLEIIGDDLYYIGMGSYLYKVNINGGDALRVTNSECHDYYIDTDSNTLYYAKGRYTGSWRDDEDNKHPIVSVYLGGGEEKIIVENYLYKYSYHDFKMSRDGDYLYFSNCGEQGYYSLNYHYIDRDGNEIYTDYDKNICGRRVNLKTGYREVLYSEVEVLSELIEDKMFGETPKVISISEPVIRWEEDTFADMY